MAGHSTSKFRRIALILFALLGGFCNSRAQTTNVTVAPEAAWVLPGEWQIPDDWKENSKTEGSRNLLFDRQDNPQRKESFTRVVRLLENATGVQDSGSLRLEFDPSFQELVLHRVKVHRGGKELERLDATKIKIIQPEPDLYGHIFSGEQTAVIFVEDLRVGDVVEYSYTLRGENPILDGHYSRRFVVQGSSPIDRERVRVIWNSATPLHFRKHLTTVAPKTNTVSGATEYSWEFKKMAALSYEDDTPISYAPNPVLEFSDFGYWYEVANWALPLYPTVASDVPPEIKELLAKWQAGNPKDEQARLALDFVQDSLRYTGIELGPDSYRPTPPYETFRLRYGDCKAKAYLLCTLLRQMNIEAYPALVSTYARETMSDRLPSPFAFNHAIVKIVIDGAAYWVDATRSYQGGQLGDRYIPAYGKALVLKKGVTALEDIPLSRAKASQQITSTFRLKNYKDPASFTVNTIYYGWEADKMREYLADIDPKEMSKNNLNFYARYYAGIKELENAQVTDDRQNNVLGVTEYYRVNNLWERDKKSERLEATFYADALENKLPDPDTRLRTAPLGFPYPWHRVQDVIVHLPETDWDLDPTENAVDSEAFAFHFRRKGQGSTVQFHYDCETKLAALPAEKVAAYLKKRDEMNALLGDTLYRPEKSLAGDLSQVNWLMVGATGFGMVATVMACVWIWYFTRSKAPPIIEAQLTDTDELKGLGGWLVFVGFGLCFGLIRRPMNICLGWSAYFSTTVWNMMAVPGGQNYHMLWGPLMIFEMLANIFLMGINALAVFMFFGKRRTFPKLFICFLAVNAGFVLLDEIVAYPMHSFSGSADRFDAPFVGRTLFSAWIWIMYTIKSRRVKATFVR